MNFKSVNKLFEASFRENWDRPAISNYQGATLHYRDLARRIEKLHIMYGLMSEAFERTPKKSIKRYLYLRN